MRRATRGLITACAGLVAGAAFGSTPALAGPTWVPPGHILGYYGSPDDCTSYAASLVLWDDDYDCDYRPQRVALPYVLVIQRPVLITQPGFDHNPPQGQPDEPMAPAPGMKEPAGNEAPVVEEPAGEKPPPIDMVPAPGVKEPAGGALSEKPAKAHDKAKPNKPNKPNKHHNKIKALADDPVAEQPVAEQPVAEQPVAEQPVAEQPVAEQPVAEQPVAEHPGCPPVVDECTDVLAVPVATPVQLVAPVRPVVPVVRPVVPVVRPVVPVVHHPLVGPWHHPWPL
ncbi:hypothetical protein QLQ12_28270 [Actinoplanes sp. NEAU-A12]|uniref:Uncharacterized protein n=1 Tax=Actinoplanes sandaracinus TaxID=3045177 RepID=A0ABT6WS08_9ACTN|nr:hypothetical protein [Actinoplanes sandaracinus]MDI6102522.1 hypothetical protein [Actinoplanes sandaracinus]